MSVINVVVDVPQKPPRLQAGDTIGVIAALEQVLRALGLKVEFGAGVAAAQRVYVERA